MQFVRLNDVNLHYQVIGSPASRPLLVFVNSLGTDFRIWRDVIVRLAGDYAILTYDMRGHGLSDVGATPYSIEMLANDLAALLDHIGARPGIICGVSVGGMVAQLLHARRPDLVQALILCDTAPKMGDAASWNARIAAIESEGIESIADAVLERWFTPAFRTSSPAFPGYRNMLIRQAMDGYIATCVALREADLTALAPQIDVPTICIVGDQDGSSSPRLVADFAKTIHGARFEIIKDCGHIPSIEQPERLVEIMRAFISFAGTETVSHVSH
jgi:3-oxoadipate enol-lactonase